MKWTLLNFFLFILFINRIWSSNSKSQSENFLNPLSSNPNLKIEKQKLIQCKLCEEMFQFNFNYEEILKSKKIEAIKKAFEVLHTAEDDQQIKGYFSKDNMEFITKEISMQYFFKGADSLIDEVNSLKFKECKNKKLGKEDENCEKIKLEICEQVLNYEEGVCVNVKSHLKALIGNQVRRTNKRYNDDRSLTERTEDNIINLKKMHFKQQDYGVREDDKDTDIIKQFGNISLLEMTPEFIKNNFSSVPKSHWQPPKPVLLQNFERNIGDQLKDISGLASEIAQLENKLKILKQQLANKLEIAQSSYNVVQKTLGEISKLVSQPNLSSSIKSPSSFTEDDWDESSKPKFLK